MEDWNEARRIEGALVDEQSAKLGIPVLLDDENLVVAEGEIDDLVREWKCPDAKRIEVDAFGGERVVTRPHKIAAVMIY